MTSSPRPPLAICPRRQVLALEPPRAPGKNGVWREGPLRKRPPSKKLFAGGLQVSDCLLIAHSTRLLSAF